MTHTGQHDRPYDGQHGRRPPQPAHGMPQPAGRMSTQQPAHGIPAPPTGSMSTGRALGLALALTVTLLAAGTGALAAAGVLFPASGQAEGKPAAPAPQSVPPALAGQPSTPPPAPEALPPPSRQTGPNGQLIAFGATVQNWNAHHRLDGAVAGGTAYNPDNAVAGNGRLADRYVRVLPLNGRILQYTIQLPRGTSFATASAQALAELPADVRLIWRQQRGACTQASYTSPTLARELTDVGDPKGAVLIEYRSGIAIGAAYDPADVTSATLSALDAPTSASGPLC
jgi:hypothetical protein